MPTIDFKPFAIGGGANVDSQAAFLAEAALGPGFSAGLAKSALVNKLHRQSSMMSAALATFISNENSADVLDDGNLANLVIALGSAIAAAAAAAVSSPIPSGTAMVFAQTAAPAGWTKVTTTNDAALRLVSGSAGSGGSVGFSSAFASQAVTGSTDGYALAAADIPSHTHKTGITDTSPGVAFINGTAAASNVHNVTTNSASSAVQAVTDGGTGGGGAHSHGLTGSSINLAVKYKDVITATKN